jgi:hypothetical protein
MMNKQSVLKCHYDLLTKSKTSTARGAMKLMNCKPRGLARDVFREC